MGRRQRLAREAAAAAEGAYTGDIGKAGTASSIVSSLFRRVGTGEIDETDIGRASKEAADKLRTDYPEAWEGGVKEPFEEFFGDQQ